MCSRYTRTASVRKLRERFGLAAESVPPRAADPAEPGLFDALAKPGRTPVLSREHKEVALFGLDELGALRMPAGYARSIRDWASRR